MNAPFNYPRERTKSKLKNIERFQFTTDFQRTDEKEVYRKQ